MIGRRTFGCGLLLGLAMGGVLLWLAAPALVRPLPPVTVPAGDVPPDYVRLEFWIVHGVTAQPLEADITLRRTSETGELIEPEKFFHGQRLTVEVPADANFVWLLVEKPGYSDWEVRLRPKEQAVVSGPIELEPLTSPASTPPSGPQS